MTPFDFQLLSTPEQVTQLYHQGVYIGKRRQEGQAVVIYQLEDFYVEITYRKYRCHIARVRCFSTTAVLDPYLEQIDVADLVNSWTR